MPAFRTAPEEPIGLPRRANILGVGISVTDYDEVVRCVADAAVAKRSLLIAASDVHSVMRAHKDAAFAAALNSLDILTPDGQPVRWGLRWTGQARLADRVYGPTLMLRVCEMAASAGHAIYLYGSRPETLDRLVQRLGARFTGLKIAGTRAGRFRPLTAEEREQDALAIVQSGAAIVFVGMGCPRQEWWLFHMRRQIALPMLAVGAAFDFHAGLVAQAPPWVQRNGLEWLYRLGREPKRLWRRYILVTPYYLPLIAAQVLGHQFPYRTELSDALARDCPG